MLVGSLVIEMLADVARLRDDVDKAVGLVERGSKKAQEAWGLAGKALGLVGVSLSATAFAGWIKGAIDAGDAASKLSARAGIAVSDVAGMQLAFELGGSSSEAMATGLAKLSKQMVEGNKAFDTLEVKTRNADGSMRNTKDVLYDVADAFAGIEDGAAKSALAQEIFGKSGSELIPVLNGGADGLREMADMADKLGLTIDENTAKSAEQFNDTVDLLGRGLTGVATRTAAELLPTLANLAGVMLETMTQGDTLTKVADGLAAGLKGLFSVGVIGVEVFSTIGKTIGAAGAQLVAVMNGDFKGAAQIGREYAKDIRSDWTGAAATLSKAWDDSGGATVQSLAKVTSAQRKLTLQTAEEAAASKKLADQKASEAAKFEKDYDSLIEKIQAKTAETRREAEAGRALTESEKLSLEVTRKYTGAKLEQALSELANLRAAEESKRGQEDLKKTLEATAKISAKLTDEQWARTDSLRAQVIADQKANDELTNQIELVGKSGAELLAARQAIAAREAAVLRSEATDLEWQAAMEGGNAALEEQARLLRKRAQLGEDRALLDAQKSYKDEWTQTNAQIGQSLTDSLMQGGKNGWEYIKGLLRSETLMPVIKMLVAPVSAGLTSLMSGPAAAAAGGGGSAGGMLGSLANIGSLFGAGGLSGSLMAGAGWMTGATSLTGALGAAGSLMGTGSMAGMLSGLGMAAGALGPIALGVALLHKLGKGDSGTQHQGSTAYADALTSRTTDGSALNFLIHGVDRNKNQDDPVRQAATSVAGILNTFSGLAGGSKFAVNTGFADDSSKDGAFGALSILRDGLKVLDWESGRTSKWAPKTFADGEEGYKQYLAALASSTKATLDTIGLPEWAQKTLNALGGAPTLDQLAAAADQIAGTANSLTLMTDAFTPLGGVFTRISSLSADAKLQLIEFAGGIDSLMQKTQSYVQAYYSDDEKAALQAASIRQTLLSAGLSTSLTNKDDLRALVEAQNENSTEGLQRIAALLNVSESFATLSDYLVKNNTTLDAVAANAPQVALLEQLAGTSTETVDYQLQTVNGITQLDTTMVDVGVKITTGFEVLQKAIELGMASIAANTGDMRDQLANWDGVDGLNVITQP